ncbi:hypothetical protein C8F01DRAFT_470457 [Mycena amicta]|nr:hypothetical protein C8F01DRAFT_470457 [Mycena amicta]
MAIDSSTRRCLRPCVFGRGWQMPGTMYIRMWITSEDREKWGEGVAGLRGLCSMGGRFPNGIADDILIRSRRSVQPSMQFAPQPQATSIPGMPCPTIDTTLSKRTHPSIRTRRPDIRGILATQGMGRNSGQPRSFDPCRGRYGVGIPSQNDIVCRQDHLQVVMSRAFR